MAHFASHSRTTIMEPDYILTETRLYTFSTSTGRIVIFRSDCVSAIILSEQKGNNVDVSCLF